MTFNSENRLNKSSFPKACFLIVQEQTTFDLHGIQIKLHLLFPIAQLYLSILIFHLKKKKKNNTKVATNRIERVGWKRAWSFDPASVLLMDRGRVGAVEA